MRRLRLVLVRSIREDNYFLQCGRRVLETRKSRWERAAFHLGNIHDVNRTKVLHILCDPGQHFVHLHACHVVVMAKPQAHYPLFLIDDGLVHSPAGPQVRQEVRHHSAFLVGRTLAVPFTRPRSPSIVCCTYRPAFVSHALPLLLSFFTLLLGRCQSLTAGAL